MLTFVPEIAAGLPPLRGSDLVVARGRFWDARFRSPRGPPSKRDTAPDVHAVDSGAQRSRRHRRTRRVGARAALRGRACRSRSSTIAATTARPATSQARSRAHSAAAHVRCHRARPRPQGWSGKVWAMAEGVAAARADGAAPRYWWFTDADVEHADERSRGSSRPRARSDRLVSLMVELHCGEPWERLLVRPSCSSSACSTRSRGSTIRAAQRPAPRAAACCSTTRSLRRIGGVERIAGELIDDCSLASRGASRRRHAVARPDVAFAQRAPVHGLRADLVDGGAHRLHATATTRRCLLAGTVAGMLRALRGAGRCGRARASRAGGRGSRWPEWSRGA